MWEGRRMGNRQKRKEDAGGGGRDAHGEDYESEGCRGEEGERWVGGGSEREKRWELVGGWGKDVGGKERMEGESSTERVRIFFYSLN